ncbi:MAG TPA: hypothetical protein VFF27_04760 [Bacteroidia bacterium]|jgi:hypothetical protein|nr:hypothetical protein [Bacteroidia bacterium]
MILTKKITLLAIFSIAMGFMETVIVVYLRKLYYPNGFNFPLVAMDLDILKAEFLREAATVVMLLAIGILTGKNAAQKFAYFIFSFAVWDIFYYVFLKILLNWPESLFTWDILFLIPLPWVGPVLAPCIISFTMIILALGIVYLQEKGCDMRMKAVDWLSLIAGSLVIIFSFLEDVSKYVIAPDKGLMSAAVPSSYNWPLFILGEAIIVLAIAIYFKRNKSGYEIRIKVLS